MNSPGNVGLGRPSQSGTNPASGAMRSGGEEDEPAPVLGLSRVDASRDDVRRRADAAEGGGRGGGANAAALAASVRIRAAAAWTFIVSYPNTPFREGLLTSPVRSYVGSYIES
jgi:hypothetical protein